MTSESGRTVARLVTVAVALASTACGGGQRPPETAPTPGGDRPPATVNAPGTQTTRQRPMSAHPDAVRLYREMGLLAEGGDTPFIGNIGFLAARDPDSTLVVLTISLSNRALTFLREGDGYRATYKVSLSLQRAGSPARRVESEETVRVPSYRETSRGDESVLFQRIVAVAPGSYDLTLIVRDETGGKSGGIEAAMSVPELGDGALSTPLPFYQVALRDGLDSLPRILPTPRATVIFGVDSVAPVYLEAYGAGSGAVRVEARVQGEGGRGLLWSDTVTLERRGVLNSGVVNVPVSSIGVGVATLTLNRPGSADTVRTPIFVSFGEDLPIASFADMISYLRYFAPAQRLAVLQNAKVEDRAAEWARFLRETDPDPSTGQHEGLNAYFLRIAQANTLYREEGTAGWLSDRGRVFIALGRPDQVYEPNSNDVSQRGRSQIWDYQRFRLRLVFVDQSGFGRWRLSTSSENDFEAVVRRELGRTGSSGSTQRPQGL